MRSTTAGSVRDLTTTFGTTLNRSTSSTYNTGGTFTLSRWVPMSGTAIAVAALPAVGDPCSNQGWRDAVAESVEPITYAAGTWTVRLSLFKSAQTVATDQVVRVSAILYRVSSAGVFGSEIGRINYPDATLTPAALILTNSFVTATTTPFSAGDRVQIECYVQTISAGTPTPPAAAILLQLTVDDTSANGGSAVTAIPAYVIRYARLTPDAAGSADSVVISSRLARATVDTASASDSLIRRAIFPRAIGDTASAIDNAARKVTFPRATADTALAVDTVVRRTTQARTTADTAGAADAVTRVLIYVRNTADNIGPNATDFTVVNGTKTIAGVVRDSAGTPVAGAIVKLFRQGDDRVVQTASSAANGAFSFVRDAFDTNAYYVLSYTTGTPQTHGVTDRDLLPV